MMTREKSDSDRGQCNITINHFELKKESEDEVMVSGLSDLGDECLVQLENSRGEMSEEAEKNSSSRRRRCSSGLLFLVKCLDLLINVNIIGLNYLNFTIRNI